jgi:hypothetical protein
MIVQHLTKWILADLAIEKQFDIEDAELMRLGYSWSEIQKFTIYQRNEFLEAATIVDDWRDILNRKKLVEIGTITSGFGDATIQKSIQESWKDAILVNIDRLSNYTLKSTVIAATQQSKPKKRKFIDVLNGAKNGTFKVRQ